LDFEKAFDKVEHRFILEMLRSKGFPSKWLDWIQMILSSSTSSVLLNGIPGKSFKCRREVRQRDPLSSLLFVIAADLLQTISNAAWLAGILKHPISDEFGGDFPIIQYADDTLLILPADTTTMFNLKGLLRSFSNSSGLHVNYHKSFMVLVNVDYSKLLHLANTVGCLTESMPFTYLGLPLSTHKPSTQSFAPLLQRIESRLFGINRMLSYHGRLLLVNSVFSAMPTYYMCTLLQPPKVIDQIDRYRKQCLWNGGDINRKGKCLAAWEATCINKKD
jgi:hypothetical protein